MQAALANVSVSVSPSEKYREYLATKGLRLTRERSIIVEEVFAYHEHFDAEQLISRLAQKTDGRRVSRSTIYRSLSQLEEASLIRKVARQEDRDVYEHDYGYPQHDHLICRKCGSLTEFQASIISKALDCPNTSSVGLNGKHQARADGSSIQLNRAGAADAVFASDVSSR